MSGRTPGAATGGHRTRETTVTDTTSTGGGIEAAPQAGDSAPDALSCRLLGDALLAKGDHPAAQRAARQAVELEPADWRNHTALVLAVLARPSLDLESMAEAKAAAERAVQLGP